MSVSDQMSTTIWYVFYSTNLENFLQQKIRFVPQNVPHFRYFSIVTLLSFSSFFTIVTVQLYVNRISPTGRESDRDITCIRLRVYFYSQISHPKQRQQEYRKDNHKIYSRCLSL